MIKTICTSCGNVRDFVEKYRGKKFKCPKCSNPVLIEDNEEKKYESIIDPTTINLTEKVNEISRENVLEKEILPQDPLPKKSNTSLIILIFILIILVAIFYFTRLNNNYQSNTIQPVSVDSSKVLKADTTLSRIEQTTLQYVSDADYYINARSDYRIYSYNYPKISSVKNAYFESQEKVHVSKIDNGFGYIEFINNLNQKVIGWVEMKDLILIGKPNSDSATQSNYPDLQPNWSEVDYERKDIMIKHIEAEDNRNYSEIINFYSEKMERYYDINNPTTDELQKRYNHLWSITNNPKSVITKIDKVSTDLYLVTFDFDYYGTKNNTHRTMKNEITYYKFDDSNKIVSLYDNSK